MTTSLKTWFNEVTQFNTFGQCGSIEELGELLAPIKRHVRGDNNYSDLNSEDIKKSIIAEAGDFLWYAAHYFRSKGYDIEDYTPVFIRVKPYVSIKDILHGLDTLHFKSIISGLKQILAYYDVTFESVLAYNIEKCKDRANRGVVQGSGDYR